MTPHLLWIIYFHSHLLPTSASHSPPSSIFPACAGWRDTHTLWSIETHIWHKSKHQQQQMAAAANGSSSSSGSGCCMATKSPTRLCSFCRTSCTFLLSPFSSLPPPQSLYSGATPSPVWSPCINCGVKDGCCRVVVVGSGGGV